MNLETEHDEEDLKTIIDFTDIPMTEINAQSDSFKFLEDEPDLYSLNNIKKKYV